MDYQVADMMTSASSAYSYYPNYHNHSHLHHHHHMHNGSSDILSNASLSNHTSAAQLSQVSSSSVGLYHEYGLSMEPNFYETEAAAYYGNHSNLSDHHMSPSSPTQQTTYSTTSSNTDMHSDSSTSHIISSDNGLSYTNLDYTYGQTHPNPLYLQQTNDKSAIAHAYNATSTPAANIESNNLHHPQSASLWQTQTTPSNHHPLAGYGDNATPPNSQMNHQQMPCIPNQTTLNSMPSTANDMPNNCNYNSRSETRTNAPTNNAPAPNSASQQPTYKWMQVKRNMPKPQGEFCRISSGFLEYFHLNLTFCSENSIFALYA